MSRKLKIILGLPAAVIIAALIAIYFIITSYDFNSLKPQISKIVKDNTGRELSIDGDIDLNIGLTPSLVLSDIRFQNASWGSQQDMVKIHRFEIQIALLPLINGRIEIQHFLMLEPEILIEFDKSGKSNLVFESPPKNDIDIEEKTASESPLKLPSLTFQKLHIKNGQLALKDNRSNKTLKIGLNHFTANTEGMDRPVNIELKGNYDSKSFGLKGSLGPIQKMLDPEQVWPLSLNAEALNAEILIDGSVKDAIAQKGINLDVSIKVPDLKDISAITGGKLPLIQPLEISGNVKDLNPRIYTVSDLRVSFSESSITGQLTFDINNKVPYISANLLSQKLDLRPFTGNDKNQKPDREASDNPTRKANRIFPDKPLNLEQLKQVNADLHIQAEKILVHKVTLNNAESSIIIKDGSITVKPLYAEIDNSSIEGYITMKPQARIPALETELKISNLNLGILLRDLEFDNIIEGDLDAEIDLKGKGHSVAELIADLKGHTITIMKNGKLNMKHLNLLGGNLGSDILHLLNPIKGQKDFTRINCLVNRFDFRDGFANNTVMLIDTTLMSIVAAGTIDLSTEALDISIIPSPKKDIAGFSLSLGELARPFKLAGTLAEPSLAIDSSKATLALGKAAGGIALFGPLGIAAALFNTDQAEEDPCQAAIEIAETGKLPPSKKDSVQEQQPAQEPADALMEEIQGLGNALKGLFGR